MLRPKENQHHPGHLLTQIGITHPESIPTRQASRYLTEIKGIPTAESSLEVYRSTGRGPCYKKIGSRVFYTLDWLDKYAAGIEIKIYDPSKVKEAA
jgi:hypothetical protein